MATGSSSAAAGAAAVGEVGGAAAVPEAALSYAARSWWDEINNSPSGQDKVFFSLSAGFAAIAAVALIQLIRIHMRVPHAGWTTQKIFHFMNFIVNAVYALIFGFHAQVFLLQPKVLTSVLLDFPGLLFFSTYTLLVLFWAEIHDQANGNSTEMLRPIYIAVNALIYGIQICIWIVFWIDEDDVVIFVGKIYLAAVALVALLGFVICGGRIYFMLRSFPLDSKARRRKLREVGAVTSICFTCFSIRCFVIALSAFDKDASLEVLNHPLLNLIFYTLTEILPSALVLFILGQLPAKPRPPPEEPLIN